MKALNLIGTRNPSIDQYMSHRAKVIARKQEIANLKLDIEQGFYDEDEPDTQMYSPYFKGTHRIEKEQKRNYMKWVGYAALTIVVGYLLAINLFDF